MVRSLTFVYISSIFLIGELTTHPLFADVPAARPQVVDLDSESPKEPLGSESIPSESEAIALRLVEVHLPELQSVLKQLRETQPRQYEAAIRQLSKAANRLETSRSRDPQLFEIELEVLQAEQQVSLLIARLKVRDSRSDRQKLRDAAERLQRSQTTRAEYEVEAIRQRIAKSQQQLDSAINRVETRKKDASELLEKSYQNMLRKAGRDEKRNNN